MYLFDDNLFVDVLFFCNPFCVSVVFRVSFWSFCISLVSFSYLRGCFASLYNDFMSFCRHVHLFVAIFHICLEVLCLSAGTFVPLCSRFACLCVCCLLVVDLCPFLVILHLFVVVLYVFMNILCLFVVHFVSLFGLFVSL